MLDALDTSIDEYILQEYYFEVVLGTGLKFQAKLSIVQLINDPTLTVVAPDGTLFSI